MNMANFNEAQLRAKLIIDPPGELRFIGPFTSPVITTLKLSNPSDESILFKIKTTAPKRYCVRPNFGCIAPNDKVSVEICLQPFIFDPYEKNKHKFMVQSLVCPSDEKPHDPNKYWKELPQENFMDAKLKCVFEMPEGPRENVSTTAAAVKNEDSSSQIGKSSKLTDIEKKILNFNMDDVEAQADEVKQLREENSNLRKEVLKLKEQVIRVRSSPSKPPMGEPYTPVMAEKQIPMFYIAIAIAAIIFGILFGKFLL